MASENAPHRILIVAPFGRDAAAIAQLLNDHGYATHICVGAAEATARATAEAGALLLTEEALDREYVQGLLNQLGAQPAWSELPVIILTRGGESRSARLLDLAATAAGSITLLERPLASATLLRTVEVALRSRRRQYQVRELLEALLTREAALQEADRRKDVFLAILSHELRNPLAPIRNAAELLSSPKLNPTQLRWAQSIIRRQTGHMAALLDELLDVARITEGKLRLRLQSCSLKYIVEVAVETAQPLLESKGHRLSVCIPDDIPLLTADSVRLAQAIANLLTNAAKYTDVGGAIELKAHLQGALVITVTDNGIGIPPDQLGRLFNMFSQASSGNRSEGGLGIGLALVRGIVELHGGSVQARSAGPGKGSEFTLRLPVSPTAAADLMSRETEPQTVAFGRLRILIADDNADAADSLAMLLSHDGHEVRTVYGGQSAVAALETFVPEVALLDIGMPDLDGFAVAEAIRRQHAGLEVRLIALTGWGQEDDKHRTRLAGFAAHLTKPVDPQRVRALLAQLQNGDFAGTPSSIPQRD